MGNEELIQLWDQEQKCIQCGYRNKFIGADLKSVGKVIEAKDKEIARYKEALEKIYTRTAMSATAYVESAPLYMIAKEALNPQERVKRMAGGE